MIKIAFNSLLLLSVSFAVTSGAPVDEAIAAVDSAKDAVQGVSEQVVDQGQQGHQELRKHLGNLYANGQKIIKNAAGELQPDINTLGQDINGLYDKAKKNVYQHVEPLAQTVRPYLKRAESYVEPYVKSAQETVPKLVHDALPALQQVGQQVGQQVRPTIDSVREQVGPAIESVRGQITNLFGGSQDFAPQGRAQAPAQQETPAPAEEQAQQVAQQASAPSAQ